MRLITSLIFILAFPSSAISQCFEVPESKQLLESGEIAAVFSGTVVSLGQVQLSMHPEDVENFPFESTLVYMDSVIVTLRHLRATLLVDSVWKGEVPDLVEVHVPGDGPHGVRFRLGGRFLVYARQDSTVLGKVYLTNLCQRTRLLTPDDNDLEVLGPPIKTIDQIADIKRRLKHAKIAVDAY